MEISNLSKRNRELPLYLLVATLFILPVGLFHFFLLHPYGLLETYQRLLPFGLLFLIGLSIGISLIVIRKTRNYLLLSGIIGIVLLGSFLFTFMSDLDGEHRLLMSLIICSIFPVTVLAFVYYAFLFFEGLHDSTVPMPKVWVFLLVSIVIALSTFTIQASINPAI